MLKFQNKHASFEKRNSLIGDRLPPAPAWVLDVGSNTGFTTKYLGALGHYAIGIEKMKAEYKNAHNNAGETSAFLRADVSPAFFRHSPHWSAILLLSVLHRIYALDGEETMRSVFACCAEKTDVLFVEGSTRHARYTDQGQPAPDFVEHEIASAGAWHEALFNEVLGSNWQLESKHVLEHTKKEPHRILYHLTKMPTGDRVARA